MQTVFLIHLCQLAVNTRWNETMGNTREKLFESSSAKLWSVSLPSNLREGLGRIPLPRIPPEKKKAHANSSRVLSCFECSSFSSPQTAHEVKKKQTFCQSWEWLPVAPCPVTSLSVTALSTSYLLGALPLKRHKALSAAASRLCFANKPGYLVPALLFIPSEMGDSIFRLCLRATHSVSTRCQRQMTELFWGMKKAVPKVGGTETHLELWKLMSDLRVTFMALISTPSFFQPLRGNEMFPP